MRLGLIGDEYKNVRKHLLANLDGDLAWRYDKSTYECLKKIKGQKESDRGEKMKDRYYFAYGSNMNLEQMKYRCPAAEVVENVRLENYRLAFRGRAPGNGVATVLPEKEAMSKESYGKSQKRVRRVWIL